MMQVKAKRDCVVDGLGLLKAGETITLTNKQKAKFFLFHGYPVEEMNSTVVEIQKAKPKTKKKEDS